uniref:Glucan endo-1,3-beta-D-glucosidase n=1 Tax=Ananas comosus var. bracteatus TaxID=296719 RepID=A0A6V7NKN5_ANACO|nr:unnamed protein product [Ananas comosus var. bracteatus]
MHVGSRRHLKPTRTHKTPKTPPPFPPWAITIPPSLFSSSSSFLHSQQEEDRRRRIRIRRRSWGEHRDGGVGLLSARDLAAFLVRQRITHVRLYDADAGLLSALAGTGVRVVVGVPNSHLLALAASPASALSWLQLRVMPFLPATLVSHLALGDDLPISAPSLLPLLPPALSALSAALSSLNLSRPSSSPRRSPSPPSSSTLPPSQASFNRSLVPSLVLPLLGFLSNTSSPLMVDLYPYYALTESRGAIPSTTPSSAPSPGPRGGRPQHPPPLHQRLRRHGRRPLLRHARPQLLRRPDPRHRDRLALLRRPPNRALRHPGQRGLLQLQPHQARARALGHAAAPGVHPGVFIYELFDEDLRPGPASEANWGLFYGNGTPVYLLHVDGAGGSWPTTPQSAPTAWRRRAPMRRRCRPRSTGRAARACQLLRNSAWRELLRSQRLCSDLELFYTWTVYQIDIRQVMGTASFREGNNPLAFSVLILYLLKSPLSSSSYIFVCLCLLLTLCELMSNFTKGSGVNTTTVSKAEESITILRLRKGRGISLHMIPILLSILVGLL